MSKLEKLNNLTTELTKVLREGFQKKSEKVWSFAKPGGGVSEGGEKTKLLFLKKVFFREYLESF